MAKAKNKAVTAVDILKYARALLARRGGWTKGVYARNKKGEKVPLRGPDAICFCADGSLMRSDFDLKGDNTAYGVAYAALSEVADHDIVLFNDAQKSKTPVVRAFDQAIAKLEAKNG
jgi:hypothetical protein